MSNIIAILNPKGGSGKTTLSINLGRALQNKHYRVLLVDTDPQGTARDWSLANQENHPNGNFPMVVGIDRPVLEKELPQVRDAFDFVLIDGAAKLQDMTASALKIATGIIIPVQTSLADIWSATDLIELIKARQQVTQGSPKAAFVVSRQIQNTRLAADVASALAEFEFPIFSSRTSNRVIYMESLSQGSTVLDQEPHGAAAVEISAMADELIQTFNHH